MWAVASVNGPDGTNGPSRCSAGHTVLAVLFGMALSLPLLIGWLPFAFTIAMNGLELVIAFIQAYIFTILTCVYLGDALHLHGHEAHAH